MKALAALAHPLSLRVFRALVVTGPSGLTPGVVQETPGVPAAMLSFHLKEMANAGLITPERADRNLVYRAEFGRMDTLLGYLTESARRRRHLSVAQWRELLGRFEPEAETVAEFCTREGVCAASFYRWRSRLAGQVGAARR